jgi:hypothetical protein
MGTVAAKDGLLYRLKTDLDNSHLLNPVFDIFAWAGIICLREFAIGDRLDIFYVPVLIVVALGWAIPSLLCLMECNIVIRRKNRL